MTKIEQVARAIMIEDGCGGTVAGERVFCNDPRLGDQAMSVCTCRNVARAAIEAMREPTEVMLDASWTQTRNVSGELRMMSDLADPKASHLYKSRARFQAMIDAALNEQTA